MNTWESVVPLSAADSVQAEADRIIRRARAVRRRRQAVLRAQGAWARFMTAESGWAADLRVTLGIGGFVLVGIAFMWIIR